MGGHGYFRSLEPRPEIGGSRFELIPVTGGETEDARIIHVPEHDVMFVGDIIMP